MKRMLYVVSGLLCSLLLVTTAWGCIIYPPDCYHPCQPGEECEAGYEETEWIDEITGDVVVMMDSPYKYTHFINDGTDGFVVGQDSATSAILEIEFEWGNWYEIAIIDFLSGWTWSSTNNDITVSLNDTTEDYIENTGYLDVTIFTFGCWSEFKVTNSKLTVKGCTPVPEPSTMALFGTGIIVGLGGVAKGRKRKK